MEKTESTEIKEIRRVTWIGLVVNVVLSAFKMAAGYYGRSRAVMADGVHSLSDTATDAALLIGVKYWTAPPDSDHPHGHRRIETIITMFIGVLLAIVGLGIGWDAIVTVHEKHSRPPGAIALVAALVSIVVKEIIYRWTVAVGRRVKSSALEANAWHHRSDGLSSIPAAVAVGGAYIFPQLYFLDHVGAIIVTLFILRAAWKIALPAADELADAGATPEEMEQITRICRETEGVESCHKIRTRRLGPGLQVDLHIQVDPGLSVQEGHDISENVKKHLMDNGPDIIDVVAHLEPEG
ncbi:cation diffusion facilitator family transporter [bacterium]